MVGTTLALRSADRDNALTAALSLIAIIPGTDPVVKSLAAATEAYEGATFNNPGHGVGKLYHWIFRFFFSFWIFFRNLVSQGPKSAIVSYQRSRYRLSIQPSNPTDL